MWESPLVSRESTLRPTTNKMNFTIYDQPLIMNITMHMNKDRETYFSKGEGELTIYSFTRDFEDIWTQADEDLEKNSK